MRYRGITYKERATNEGSSPREVFKADGATSTRIFDVPWANRQNAIFYLLGYPQDKGSYVSRITPHFCAEWSNTTNDPYLFCSSVETQGLGPGDGSGEEGAITEEVTANGVTEAIPVYQTCRLTAHYDTPLYEILDDADMASNGFTDGGHPDESTWERYVQVVVKPQGEFISLPMNGTTSTSYRYVGLTAAESIIQQGVHKLLVPYNLQVSWKQVPETFVQCFAINPNLSDFGAVDAAIGCVNATTWNGYVKGTLLFMGVEFRPYRSAFGDRIYDCTFMFKYFEPLSAKGHNYLFKPYAPSGPGWLEVTTDGATNVVTQADSKSIYDWAEFADIMRGP